MDMKTTTYKDNFCVKVTLKIGGDITSYLSIFKREVFKSYYHWSVDERIKDDLVLYWLQNFVTKNINEDNFNIVSDFEEIFLTFYLICKNVCQEEALDYAKNIVKNAKLALNKMNYLFDDTDYIILNETYEIDEERTVKIMKSKPRIMNCGMTTIISWDE